MRDAVADAARSAEARVALHARLCALRPLLSPRVAAAFLYVPRHPFVPWQEAVGRAAPPLAEADALDALDVRRGDRVLEVGTGSGYGTALLSWLTGPGSVTSTDRDADGLARARERLGCVGYRPLLAVAAPAEGHRARGPYDRVIAHAPVDRVPAAWLEQCAPGGLLAARVNGALVLLQTGADGTAAGRLLPVPDDGEDEGGEGGEGGEEGADEDGGAPGSGGPPGNGWPGLRRRTEVPARVLEDRAFAFFARLHLPGTRVRHGDAPVLAGDDGSLARVSGRTVTVTGQRDLWRVVERAYATWLALHRPRREWFEMRVAGGRQWFAYRRPDGSELTWDLPCADPFGRPV